ncbi:hypothetical protein E4U21_001738 [Claviceps maximensis]|nr:hypothetical protein E4U21_001738 [Claviceps maximensis]
MTTRNTLSGPITLSRAMATDADILHKLTYPQQKKDFFQRINSHRSLLADVVGHHLGTDPTEIVISPEPCWLHGSFNLIVQIHVTTDPIVRQKRNVPEWVILRFPLPFRVGEGPSPGNSDEKINYEAATYAWLQENCPTVPIPKLYGFGLSTNQRFTHVKLLPWWTRWFRRIRNYFLAAFGFPQPSQYVPHCSSRFVDLDVGYLLIETITSGKMLSSKWTEKCKDARRQENLQRGLARIMLSLTSVSLPRIGSFRLDDKGYLHLDSRPLTIPFVMHENEGLPLDMPRSKTFSHVDDFVHSHLTAFENRLIHQLNGVRNYGDACRQTAALAAAKLAFSQTFRKELNNGPFVYTLSDVHRSNIIVDEDWNIICMLDLEFACSLPVEFALAPYWLEGQLIDQIDMGYLPKYKEFIKHMEHEEKLQISKRDGEPLSSTIRQTWNNGTYWAILSLGLPVSFTGIFYDKLLTYHFSFPPDHLDDLDYTVLARLWRCDVFDIIDLKLKDYEKYTEKVKETFTDITSVAQ